MSAITKNGVVTSDRMVLREGSNNLSGLDRFDVVLSTDPIEDGGTSAEVRFSA